MHPHISRALTTAILALVFASICVTSFSSEEFPENPELVDYLGTVDGKRYYVERKYSEETFFRNWSGARQFCRDQRMQLARVDSAAQVEFLARAYNNETFDGCHWTAGRDAGTLSQMVWDTTGEVPANYDSLELAYTITSRTCLAYCSKNLILVKKRYYGYSCESLQKVLCEVD